MAGPGLPAPVVKAYADDKAVVLFVFRHRGIDDAAVRASVERLAAASDLARVRDRRRPHRPLLRGSPQGVDVNRVPALIVLRPRHLTHGTPDGQRQLRLPGPTASSQAVRDALYKGPTNLPYYPR